MSRALARLTRLRNDAREPVRKGQTGRVQQMRTEVVVVNAN